jgi:hypothetical protein
MVFVKAESELKVMYKKLALSLSLISFATSAYAQSTSDIFVDCEVVRSYNVPEKKFVRESLNFKIDTSNSIIYEFDFDKGKYDHKCLKSEGDLKIGESSGYCMVNDEAVRFTNLSQYGFFHNSESITIYRSSGKIRGDLSMYQGPFKRGEFDSNKRPMVEYKINGTCQQGADLSRAKKAF